MNAQTVTDLYNLLSDADKKKFAKDNNLRCVTVKNESEELKTIRKNSQAFLLRVQENHYKKSLATNKAQKKSYYNE